MNTLTDVRRRRWALAALALPTLLVAIDISVMGVALPSLARDLHPSAAELLWIIDSYNFLVAGSMLATGAIGDRIGRRRMILICAAVFAAASAVGAFATTPLLVILARAVMGMAGSAIMPASMSLIGVLFTDTRARIQAMGAYMTVFLGGMAVAPFVGGLLLAHFWWGSVFLVGVPVMAVTIAVVPRLLPETRSEQAPRIDLLSTAQSLAAILAIVYALKAWVNDGATASVWLALTAGIVLAALFARRQRRLDNPLLDLSLIGTPAVARTLAALFLTSVIMGGSSLFFNLYLQDVQGLTPLEAAWWTLPQIVLMIAASNLGPWLNRHLPQRTVVLAMLLVMTLGFILYAFLPVTWAGRPLAAAGAALAAFGIGAAFPLLMDHVISAAPPQRAGAGAALAQVSNELGIAVGLTVLGSLGTVVYRARLDLPGTTAAGSVVDGVRDATARGDLHLLAGVRAAFTDACNVVGLAGVAVLLLVLALTRRGHVRSD
ncbi:MFS transporter [Nonomuraea fuscirosea]|jgi:MFS transporter, DHA2 family, multidrug resistance protein|uniref:MFS transporter n=1 Tax=Nonomuraea fuscirosea TaxID=1291556 RepID=UPI002DD8234D|nr:MFS transporter [Nonomuraea fuscirosea]WSA53777.1 MFS transporter [Nonomuraea fuscirosea]